jgi:hypothetical protein
MHTVRVDTCGTLPFAGVVALLVDRRTAEELRYKPGERHPA